MSDKYIYKKGIVYKNQYHIIFCPKYRRKVLINNIALDLKNILYQIAEDKDVEIKALEIMPDHVHMFIEIDPRLMLHKVMIIDIKLKYLGKQLQKIDTYKVKASQYNHFNNSYEKKSLKERWNKTNISSMGI